VNRKWKAMVAVSRVDQKSVGEVAHRLGVPPRVVALILGVVAFTFEFPSSTGELSGSFIGVRSELTGVVAIRRLLGDLGMGLTAFGWSSLLNLRLCVGL